MHHVYVDWTEEAIPRPFYVGQGDDYRLQRVQRNPKHTNVKNKYGIRREVVLTTEDASHALEVERLLVAELHTFVDDGEASSIACNWTPGGEGCSHAQETRERIRTSVTAQWQDPTFREQRRQAMRGKTRSEETKRLLSRIGKGRKLSSEIIARRSESNRGSKRGPETRAKMSEARRAWWARRGGKV
jgi:hypothetical protein